MVLNTRGRKAACRGGVGVGQANLRNNCFAQKRGSSTRIRQAHPRVLQNTPCSTTSFANKNDLGVLCIKGDRQDKEKKCGMRWMLKSVFAMIRIFTKYEVVFFFVSDKLQIDENGREKIRSYKTKTIMDISKGIQSV